MIRGNTSGLIDHPIPKHFVSAHGASHHAWAPGPHHLNPALNKPFENLSSTREYGRIIKNKLTFVSEEMRITKCIVSDDLNLLGKGK